MKKLFCGFLVVFCFLLSCQNTETKTASQLPAAQRVNAVEQINKPIVIMISIDGFRHDYLEKFKPPTLLRWAKAGVRAEGLIPSFPTLTFPNHISLITGLRPGHHGIVGNKFYEKRRKKFYAIGDNTSVNDGSWYRGTPLWAAAEKEGMLSATCFWVGSEATIGGIDPTYLKPYDAKISNDQRVTWVTDWLKLPDNKKPHFISLYFSDVDSNGHYFGPDAEETKRSVLAVDSSLSHLEKFIEEEKMDVQIVVVSDHGMKTIEKTVDLSSAISLKKFKTSGKGALVFLYANDDADIEKTYQDIKKIPGPFRVYKANEYPERWQLDDINRKGDIIVVGEPGVYIGFQDDFTGKAANPMNKATHGWDVESTTDMNGLFIATGSLFKKGLRIPAFENVHVFPLVKSILDLRAEVKIDGQLDVLKPILRSSHVQ